MCCCRGEKENKWYFIGTLLVGSTTSSKLVTVWFYSLSVDIRNLYPLAKLLNPGTVIIGRPCSTVTERMKMKYCRQYSMGIKTFLTKKDQIGNHKTTTCRYFNILLDIGFLQPYRHPTVMDTMLCQAKRPGMSSHAAEYRSRLCPSNRALAKWGIAKEFTNDFYNSNKIVIRQSLPIA